MRWRPCTQVLKRVIQDHVSLTIAFEEITTNPEQKAVCYGVLRWFFQLDFILGTLLHKPLKQKNQLVTFYLYIGLFQLLHSHHPAHAIVFEIVNEIKQTRFQWATGLVNKILRQCITQKESLIQKITEHEIARYAHPAWMIDLMSPTTLDANNQPAPMTLRVNLQKISRADYFELLQIQGIGAVLLPNSPTAIQLDTPVDVSELPHFALGFCSVQDEAGQEVAAKMQLKPGLSVLDACAAPGSKTTHLLEAEPRLAKLVALDIDPLRLQKIKVNVARLGLSQTGLSILAADALDTKTWWDGNLFDRILIDAPCSASGVIRRHPDIKVLRHPEDLTALSARQLALLKTLSPLLDPKGLIVYATCSVFSQENEQVIEQFIQSHDFKIVDQQKFPTTMNGSDGFFTTTLVNAHSNCI